MFHICARLDRPALAKDNRVVVEAMGNAAAVVEVLTPLESKLDDFDYAKQLDILHIGFIRESREAVDANYMSLTRTVGKPRRLTKHMAHGPSTSARRAATSLK